jgi:hypothetical protein
MGAWRQSESKSVDSGRLVAPMRLIDWRRLLDRLRIINAIGPGLIDSLRLGLIDSTRFRIFNFRG